MGVVDEIKAQLDLVDYISQTVKLRRTGKNYIGFCPFHSNTRTPAFVVFPESQTWRCFGQCNEGGDLFGFVMKKEGWDFNEALRILAEKAGATLSAQPRPSEADAEQRGNIIRVLDDAAQFYRSQLLESEAGAAAPMIAVGNCSALKFSITEEIKSLKDFTQAGGGTYNEVRRIESVEMSMTLHDLNADNVARPTKRSAPSVITGMTCAPASTRRRQTSTAL